MLVTWVQIPKGKGIMVRKRTGHVQFLVLLRLWTGPPQNNNNNNRALVLAKPYGLTQTFYLQIPKEVPDKIPPSLGRRFRDGYPQGMRGTGERCGEVGGSWHTWCSCSCCCSGAGCTFCLIFHTKVEVSECSKVAKQFFPLEEEIKFFCSKIFSQYNIFEGGRFKNLTQGANHQGPSTDLVLAWHAAAAADHSQLIGGPADPDPLAAPILSPRLRLLQPQEELPKLHVRLLRGQARQVTLLLGFQTNEKNEPV